MIKHEHKQIAKKHIPLSSPDTTRVKQSPHDHKAESHIDVAALAEIYNSPPSSHILREELLEEARRALMEYELAEEDLEIAAQTLARTMHMLVEQQGGKSLEPKHKAELIHHVLDWCGIQERTDRRHATSERPRTITQEELIRRPESPDQPLPKHHHATKRPH